MENNKKIICIVIIIVLVILFAFIINKVFNKEDNENNITTSNKYEDETLQQFYEDHPDFETGFEDMKSENEINNLTNSTSNDFTN